MFITSSTAALHRHGCCGSRYVASNKDHQKRSQGKQTHRNDGARKRKREREELQTLINDSGSSGRAEWPFSAHAQDLQAAISFASCFFPELGGYLIFERTVILLVFKPHIKNLRT
jgi:hypothetical protein